MDEEYEQQDDSVYGLVVTLREVPEGGRVTMKTGSKAYLVRDTVKVYRHDLNQNVVPQEIKAGEGCRFLVSPGGAHINAYSDNKVVIWYADRSDIIAFLDPEEDK